MIFYLQRDGTDETEGLEILDDGGIKNTQTGWDIYNVDIIGTRSLQLSCKISDTKICLGSV